MDEARTSGLLWPTVFAAVALAVLLSLGTWQWNRLIWKQGLIDQIEARTKAAPISFQNALRRYRAGEDMEYVRVRLEGTWQHDQERYLWAPEQAGPGWHVLTPLVTPGGDVVIVNRGYVADADRDRGRRPEPASGPAEVVGLMRRPEAKGTFTLDNEPAKNIWYWRDLDGLKRSLPGNESDKVVGFLVDAERRGPAERAASPRAPLGGATRLALPNNHLQYVLTWYGLALGLVGVYVAFVRTRLKRRETGPSGQT